MLNGGGKCNTWTITNEGFQVTTKKKKETKLTRNVEKPKPPNSGLS